MTKLSQHDIKRTANKNGVHSMKKKSVISLIKYYTEKNDVGFRSEAYEIAKDLDAAGDYQLAEYIMSLLSNANTFVPQVSENVSPFFEKISEIFIFCSFSMYQSVSICLSPYFSESFLPMVDFPEPINPIKIIFFMTL